MSCLLDVREMVLYGVPCLLLSQSFFKLRIGCVNMPKGLEGEMSQMERLCSFPAQAAYRWGVGRLLTPLILFRRQGDSVVTKIILK